MKRSLILLSIALTLALCGAALASRLKLDSRLEALLPADSASVRSLDLSANGKKLAVSGRDTHANLSSGTKVVEMFDDTEQIAAVIPLLGRGRMPGEEVIGLGNARAAGEAIGEDLVENGVFEPVGRVGSLEFGMWNHGISDIGCFGYVQHKFWIAELYGWRGK